MYLVLMQGKMVSGQHPDAQTGGEGLVQKRAEQLLVLERQEES